MIPKFRAWIKEEKKMAPVGDMHFRDGELHFIRLEQNSAITYGTSWNHVPKYESKDVVLMQSTGLHDINGKEIYESDVVEITYNKQVWDAIPAYCGSRKAKYDYRIDSLEDFFYTRKRNYIADSEFKVLGNIYENPELAKVVNKQ